jgi:malonyl-CoA O-methyltransferase
LPSLRRLYRAEAWGQAMADLVDMHDIGDQLVEAGFTDPVMDQEVVRLTWSSPQAALQELRSLGSNLSPTRQPGLRTPRWHDRLRQALEQDAEQAGLARITMEFELVYGHAFKAPPVHRVEPQTHIALDDLRDSLKRKRNEPYR